MKKELIKLAKEIESETSELINELEEDFSSPARVEIFLNDIRNNALIMLRANTNDYNN